MLQPAGHFQKVAFRQRHHCCSARTATAHVLAVQDEPLTRRWARRCAPVPTVQSLKKQNAAREILSRRVRWS